ncbi:hypothetical protein SPONN_2057 [uncultured Candidatus Thioglobus sp.]|nr:hypothetical protein SPONN_2057 [uncultured Candidatus Thioglobus sp.]
MRISPYLQNLFKQIVSDKLPNAHIILFGSRVYDNKFGGDFDLAIKGNFKERDFKNMQTYFFKQLLLKDLDLPIDLINYNQTNGLFKQEINKGVEL